jgi:hypothetical protein
LPRYQPIVSPTPSGGLMAGSKPGIAHIFRRLRSSMESRKEGYVPNGGQSRMGHGGGAIWFARKRDGVSNFARPLRHYDFFAGLARHNRAWYSLRRHGPSRPIGTGVVARSLITSLVGTLVLSNDNFWLLSAGSLLISTNVTCHIQTLGCLSNTRIERNAVKADLSLHFECSCNYSKS